MARQLTVKEQKIQDCLVMMAMLAVREKPGFSYSEAFDFAHDAVAIFDKEGVLHALYHTLQASTGVDLP